MTVKTGLEVLRKDDFRPLHGLRVGLLTNPSAVDLKLESTYSVLLKEPAVNLVALFGPEHGFGGSAHAGEHVVSAVDPRSGLRFTAFTATPIVRPMRCWRALT
jgi:uncharacterized protein YbbC (DUF1343 family)